LEKIGKRNVEKFVCPAEENPHVVVIIGGGAAAYTAIHTLRDEKFKGKVRIFNLNHKIRIFKKKKKKKKLFLLEIVKSIKPS